MSLPSPILADLDTEIRQKPGDLGFLAAIFGDRPDFSCVRE